ncbi:hypothetical protein C8J57DRAFT_1211413 [Mycena rebaudengoi]|nr:hypothetical protein C8J57DRAFT_1211413 [Mycena rebaudengoi]
MSPPQAPPPDHATYLNNIPLGMNGAPPERRGCYGCQQDGHRIFECPLINELIRTGVIQYNEEAQRLTMKDGTEICKGRGETLVQAATRIGSVTPPVVLLGFIDTAPQWSALPQTFYQEDSRRPRIAEVFTKSEDENFTEEVESETYYIEPETGNPDGRRPHKVYLSMPQATSPEEPTVHTAE